MKRDYPVLNVDWVYWKCFDFSNKWLCKLESERDVWNDNLKKVIFNVYCSHVDLFLRLDKLLL